MKKFIVLAIALLMVVSTVFAQGAPEEAGDQSLEKIKAKGVFVLGLDDSFPPMGYRDENNEIVGFDIDIAKEVCKGLGVELKCQPIDWSAKEQELATGQIDCIWNVFTYGLYKRYFMLFYCTKIRRWHVDRGSVWSCLFDFGEYSCFYNYIFCYYSFFT